MDKKPPPGKRKTGSNGDTKKVSSAKKSSVSSFLWKRCHMTSETHLRQMKIFSENARGFMDTYSINFEKLFVDTLRRRHTTNRVDANRVYQQVIQDKQHIHMNATRWVTLTDFVQYLGKTGKCVVDETERGWHVQYIERDASILHRRDALKRRVKADKEAEDAQVKRMGMQRIEAAKAFDRLSAFGAGTLHLQATKIERPNYATTTTTTTTTLSLALHTKKNNKKNKHRKPNNPNGKNSDFFNGSDTDDDHHDDDAELIEEDGRRQNMNLDQNNKKLDPVTDTVDSRQSKTNGSFKQNDSSIKSQKTMEKKRDIVAVDKVSTTSKKKRQRQDDYSKGGENKKEDEEKSWLIEDIIVRIISKKKIDGNRYFKRKAIVDRISKKDEFVAYVEILDSDDKANDGGDILRLDQDDLDTVVGKEGNAVLIVRGDNRGKEANIISLNKNKYRATLKLEKKGTILEKVDFEDFSKLA